MSLTKQDLQDIRIVVKEVVTDAITTNNAAIAGMFESQNDYIDNRFNEQDKRIDNRFIEERAVTRSMIHAELADIRERLAQLEKRQDTDIKSALIEIEFLHKELNALKAKVLKLKTA